MIGFSLLLSGSPSTMKYRFTHMSIFLGFSSQRLQTPLRMSSCASRRSHFTQNTPLTIFLQSQRTSGFLKGPLLSAGISFFSGSLGIAGGGFGGGGGGGFGVSFGIAGGGFGISLGIAGAGMAGAGIAGSGFGGSLGMAGSAFASDVSGAGFTGSAGFGGSTGAGCPFTRAVSASAFCSCARLSGL